MSFDAIPVLDGDFNAAYLLTPTERIDVIGRAPTPEAAAIALCQALPPSSVKKSAIVMCNGLFLRRRNCVEALQKAGYANVESIDPLCVIVTSSILGLSLKCVIDEPVLVSFMSSIIVIKKCEIGWQYVECTNDINTTIDRHPSIRNIVMFEDTPEYTELRKSYPDKTFHPVLMNDDYKDSFVRIHNSNAYPDYEMYSRCSVDLHLTFGNKVDTIKLIKRLPPFTITKEYDIGDVSEVRTFAVLPGQVGKAVTLPIVKTFNFSTKAFRIVSMTVTVDKTLIPQVTLKTVSTYKPPKQRSADVFFVEFENKKYYLGAVYPDRKTNEGSFDSADEIVTYMTKTFSKAASSTIYFIDSPDTRRSDLRDFKTACQKAGCTNVTFLASESVNLSLVLDSAQVVVGDDQVIAVFDSYKYRIIRRDGKCLKIVKRDASSKFDVQEAKVDVIVIDNSKGVYTKTDLDYLRSKFSQCTVYVTPETEQHESRLPMYLWSLANGTDFGGNIFNNFGDFEFAIEEHGAIMEGVEIARFTRFPYVLTITYHVQFTDTLHLHLQTLDNMVLDEIDEYKVHPGNVVQFTVTVKSACNITVKMDVLFPFAVQRVRGNHSVRELPLPRKKKKKKAVEILSVTEPANISITDVTAKTDSNENLPKQLSELTLNPPNAVFTFTSDNRVLIEVNEAYTGVKEVLAYVRLRVGKEPQVGTKAFDALKKHPASVFYGITRLLATDFDPDYPDPSWGFKTTRDADGKVVIRSADDIMTFPIVLFGLVIQSTLLYIRKHTKSDVKSIGLKLPTGSTVSADALEEVSKRIGVKLSLIVTPS